MMPPSRSASLGYGVRRRSVLAALMALAPGPVAAQRPPRPQTAVPEARVVPSNGVLGIIAGGVGGTYIRIAADIAAVVEAPQLRVLPIVGLGSLQNISDLLNVRDVDVAIVQSDVLAYLRQRRAVPGAEGKIAYVAKLYDEEVHVLARPDIRELGDLAGQRVNLDRRGSGTALTASVLLPGLGVEVEPVYDDQETALAKLKRGEIAAMMYVAGKPARLFAEAGGESGLRLLAVPLDPALLETYTPSRLEHVDYPGLIAQGAAVDTVAVGAVMAVYNWPPGTERHARLTRFIEALFDKLPELRQPPRHPKWRDVSLSAQVPGWTRFPAAQLWLQRLGAALPSPAVPERR